MAAPTIDFAQTRFPIAVKSDLPDGAPTSPTSCSVFIGGTTATMTNYRTGSN